MGEALASVLGARMGGDQLAILRVDPHLAATAAHLNLLANQTEGRRIEGVVEHRIAIAMHLCELPDRQVVGCSGQRVQPMAFVLLKLAERLGLGRAVAAQPGL